MIDQSAPVPNPGASPIFHIGMHKTATSWFQKRFYPKVEGHRYVDREIVRSTLLTRSPLDFNAAEARAKIGLDEGLPAIVCEEDLCGVLHNGGLLTNYIAKEIARQLYDISPDARIVIFVRSQTALAASSYHQYLRDGGTGSVHRYLFPEDYLHLGKIRPLVAPRFDFTQFEHDRLVAHYDSLFGRDRVFVFAQESFARDGEQFLREFCRQLDLTIPQQLDFARINSSYGRGLIPVARFLNLFTRRAVADKSTIIHIPYWYPVRRVLLRQLNSLGIFGKAPSARELLGEATFEWIRQRFWQNNQRLQLRMGMDLRALGYAVDPPAEIIERPKRAAILRPLVN